jgi:FkbM family methyltransferase
MDSVFITEIKTEKDPRPLKVLIENVNEYQQRYWANGQFYERELLDLIKEDSRPGNFIDIGSCMGNHTLFFSRIAKIVYSFEPCLPRFVTQYYNIRLNGIKNVKLFNCALGNENKIVYLDYKLGNIIKTQFPIKGKDFEYVSNYGNSMVSNSETENVCIMKKLDDFNIEDVSVIKIDVEWYEVEVLKGALNTLRKYKPDIYVEIADEKNLKDILDVIAPLGCYNEIIKFNNYCMYKLCVRENEDPCERK